MYTVYYQSHRRNGTTVASSRLLVRKSSFVKTRRAKTKPSNEVFAAGTMEIRPKKREALKYIHPPTHPVAPNSSSST